MIKLKFIPPSRFLSITLLYIHLLLFIFIVASKLTKLWKSIHKGPVMQITLSNNNVLMASGGNDGTVRLWDLQYHVCTHSLKGIQGVIR